MATLTTPHERALNLLFAELERGAREQGQAFMGTPGSVAERSNAQGTRFWSHRYLDAAGKRHEAYLGTLDDPTAAERVDTLETKIAIANATINSVRLLARAGFATVDRKPFFTLASLHNHGLFAAGAFVVGSHAYGALLNSLGVRAVPYATEDIDIARGGVLNVSGSESFLEMLQVTGIPFFETPPLNRKDPSTSFGERGMSRLRVDLLAPSRNEAHTIVAVPELKAHAAGLPYLAYLLGVPQDVLMLSTHGVVIARVPVPERYAIHKLIVSQLRSKASNKPDKDLLQAATLIEVLVERFPGAVEAALESIPKSSTRYVRQAVKALKLHLPASAEMAWDALASFSA